jgi:hypothetical protein
MWILKKKYDYWWKNTDLKRLTGRLKLRFLTEIGRLHWNQDEEVAHFAWFGEPCKESSSPHPAIVPIEGAVLFELKRLGLATISLKVDHICIISIKFGGNWIFTGFLNIFSDNNFLFFVTVTATLDDSRRSSIKILKEDHICILSIWFDCIWLFTGF